MLAGGDSPTSSHDSDCAPNTLTPMSETRDDVRYLARRPNRSESEISTLLPDTSIQPR